MPLDGGLFNIEWFPVCETIPECTELVMSVDVAGTEGGGNYTAVTVWGILTTNGILSVRTDSSSRPPRFGWRFQRLISTMGPTSL